MDAEQLQRELQGLQRGRGVARPHVRTWAGPLLRELLQDTPDKDEETLRTELASRLVDAAMALPTDLRYLFLVAAGIESDEPLLTQRLSGAGHVLDRDARTLSRYLRKAEALLASLLIQSDGEQDQPYDSGAWTTTRLSLDIDLTRPQPLASLTQVVRSLRSDQTEFRHTVAVAEAPPPGSHPRVAARSGCRLERLEALSERSWVAVFAVPPIARGRSLQVQFDVQFPNRGSLLPFAAFAPIRPCASFDVRVALGDPPPTTDVWRVDAVPPPLVTDRPRDTQPLTLDAGVGSASFTALRPGFAYGIAWSAS